MSTALRILENTTKQTFVVAGGQSTTEGLGVIFSGADTDIATAGANSNFVMGVALETKSAGQRCSVALFDGGVIPVKVGTGGATRGAKAKVTADGFADAPTLADGATVTPTYGIFMQSGVLGDFVGMQPSLAFVHSV